MGEREKPPDVAMVWVALALLAAALIVALILLIKAVGFVMAAASANPFLFLVIFVLGGLGLGFRHFPEARLDSLSVPFLIVAATALPHFLFLAAFAPLVSDGIEPAKLTAPLASYERVALALYADVRPYLGTSLLVTILLSATVFWLGWRFETPALVTYLRRYRKLTSRASLAILGASSFTIFTAVPSQTWTPDLEVRLAAQLRVETEEKVKRAVALRLGRPSLPATRSAADLIVQAAVAARTYVSREQPSQLTGQAARFAELSLKDAAADRAGELVADAFLRADAPRASTGVRTEQATAREAGLAELHEAARRAAARRRLAQDARREAKERIDSLVAGWTHSLVPHVDSELVDKIISKFVDLAVERASARIIREAGPDWLRGADEGQLGRIADRQLARGVAEGRALRIDAGAIEAATEAEANRVAERNRRPGAEIDPRSRRRGR